MKYKKIISLIITLVFYLTIARIAKANAVIKTLYVDGAKVGERIGPQELSHIFNRLTIGCEGSLNYRYLGLVGQIDDFAVYNYILSDARIASHYSQTSAAAYSFDVFLDIPLLYLQFQDASSANGATAANSGTAGASLNGKYYSSSGTLTLRRGRFSDANAANLRGTTSGSGDCIDVGDTAGLISLDTITVELWVRLDANATTGYPRFFQHNNGAENMGSYGGVYVLETGTIGLIGGGNTNYVSGNPNDDYWHHIVMTYSPIIIPAGRLYSQEVMADNPVVYLRFEGDTPMETIKHPWRYYWRDPMGMLPTLDYNIPTLVGYGDPEGITRTMTEKAGGIGKSIFVDNTPVWHTGPPADWGTDGHICISTASGSAGSRKPRYSQVADDPNYAFAKGDITYEFWFKNSSSEQPQREPFAMFFQQIGSYQNEPKAPGMGFDGDNIRILTGIDWWYPGIQIPVADTQWHQSVVTYDEQYNGQPDQMKIEFYMDGILFNSRVVNGAGARLGPWLNHLLIGASGDWGYGYNGLAGYVDEFAIYAGCLDPNRIAAHYAAWQPRTCDEFIARGYGMAGDLDEDCDVDFVDLAEFVLNWLRCNDPGAGCPKNW